MSFIPVNEPVVGDAERNTVLQCLDSGWVSSEGPWVRDFEKRFASLLGRRYAIAVSSGTAALDVAVAALQLGVGDEVILPDFCIMSCAAAIAKAGACPVVLDADPHTWNMDVDLLESVVTPRTKAIMAVHTYGLPVDMDAVQACARKHGLLVIEDAAEALGGKYNGKLCGCHGDISVFSFYANKLLTTGEGGMVLTDSSAWAERARSLRNLCFNESKRFYHEEVGWNYRMSSLAAALGLAQLDVLPARYATKRQQGHWYQERLKEVAGLQLPVDGMPYAENGYWVYGVVLDDDVPFDALRMMNALRKSGIGTRPFFWPMHEQPVWQNTGWFSGVRCPVSSRLARRGFYLPGGLGLTECHVDQICGAVKKDMARADRTLSS